jgi:hypothetical protein
MSHSLNIELSDPTYRELQTEAQESNTTPALLAAKAVEQKYVRSPTNPRNAHLSDAERLLRRQRFEECFGSVAVGHPSGADNDAIDADLAREYADPHEET